MAFSDILTNATINVKPFIVVSPLNVSTGATVDLYLAHGEYWTDKVDGTGRQWSGRLAGDLKQTNYSPPLAQSKWPHPSLAFSIWLGDMTTDATWWGYLGDDYEWDGAEVKLYLCDLEQASGGSALKFQGEIVRGPDTLSEMSAHRFEARGMLYNQRLPNVRVSPATETVAGFVQTVCLNTSNNDRILDAMSATATTFYPVDSAGVKDATAFYAGNVCAVCDVTTGNNIELMYVVSTDPATNQVTVIRGFNGTDAVSHSAGDPVYTWQTGPNFLASISGIAGTLVPYVFGAGNADKNPCMDLRPLTISRATRQYGSNPLALVYMSQGLGAQCNKVWYEDDGEVGTGATPSTYNDEDNPVGTQLQYGSYVPSGVVTNANIYPSPTPTGSYFSGINVTAFNDSMKVWALFDGITIDGATGSNVHRYPNGITDFLLTDDFALGLTLSDWVASGVITGWSTGTWRDEFDVAGDEAWWSQVAGCVPEIGASEQPLVMEVLQELADLSLSDFFVVDGLLYPRRRDVAGTADYTIGRHDWFTPPVKIRDPFDLRCNGLTYRYAQTIWSNPDDSATAIANGTSTPAVVPWTASERDFDDVARRGFHTLVREFSWWYYNFADDYLRNYMASNYNPQTAHMAHLRDSCAAAFALYKQVQVWLEVTLPERYTDVEQGETIDLTASGITDRSGQIRHRELTYQPAGGWRVTVRAWCLDF